MMLSSKLVRGLLLAVTLGCGGKVPEYVDNSQDPELYAESMRRTILTLLIRAENGDACSQIGKLATELSHSDRPRGKYAEIFVAMGKPVEKVMESCRAEAYDKAAMKPYLDEIKKLAESLPDGGAGSGG